MSPLRVLSAGDINPKSGLTRRRSQPRRQGVECIIVGHNDADFQHVTRVLHETRQWSGAYQDILANSVSVGGERMTYMPLLNRTLSLSTGRAHDLNVCHLPHLGTCYLASYLKKRSIEVEVINFFNSGRQRLSTLLLDEPTSVAITTTLYVADEPIKEIIDFVRERSPKTTVIVGGPHVNNLCAEYDAVTRQSILEAIGADVYVVDSQGEATLARVVEALCAEASPDLRAIPNVIARDSHGDWFSTRTEHEHNDLNENAIDWDLFDRDLWVPTVQIRTGRSCAFKCSFCRYPIMAGPLHLTTVETVENELRRLKAAGVKNVVFIDDTFNVPLPRFKELNRMMIRGDFGFNWFSFFRCSNSDEEAFDLMQRSGCKGVFLGIESGDQEILTNMNKFADVARYRAAIAALKRRGITTFASFILGFPGETKRTVANTQAFLEETSPDFYRVELYYHYTNVPIHQQADRFGIEGAGYSWRHASMRWQEAAELVEHTYRTVRGPRILPGYMFDFWALPYLTGQGFSIDMIRRFTEAAGALLIDSFTGKPDEAMHQEALRRAVSADRDSANVGVAATSAVC